jgi:hypothetical protein
MAAKRRISEFSIETDQEVLVTFPDGTSERLQRDVLASRIEAGDYARIIRAFKVRQSFWRRHLPGGLMVMVAGATAAVAVMAMTDRPLLHVVTPQKVTASPETGSQPAKILPTPSPTIHATNHSTNLTAPAPSSTPIAAQPPAQTKGLIHRLTSSLGQMLK